jgi:hypothetical protein
MRDRRKPRGRHPDREPIEMVAYEDALKRLFPEAIAKPSAALLTEEDNVRFVVQLLLPKPSWNPLRGEMPSPRHKALDDIVNRIAIKKLRRAGITVAKEPERYVLEYNKVHLLVRRRIVFAALRAEVAAQTCRGLLEVHERLKEIEKEADDLSGALTGFLKLITGQVEPAALLDGEIRGRMHDFLPRAQVGTVGSEEGCAEVREELLRQICLCRSAVPAVRKIGELAGREIERVAGSKNWRTGRKIKPIAPLKPEACWALCFFEVMGYLAPPLLDAPPDLRGKYFLPLVEAAYASIARELPEGQQWRSLEGAAKAVKKLMDQRPDADRWFRFVSRFASDGGAPAIEPEPWTAS